MRRNQPEFEGPGQNYAPGGSPPMTPESVLPGHAKSEKQHRREICIAGGWMYERGHIVACEGNLSVRLDAENILTTPTCMNKGAFSPEYLVATDLDGRQLSGHRKFSSEMAMHLLFYRMRPDVNAICHAHPPTATGFAVAGRAIRHAGNTGIERSARTLRPALRRAAFGEPRGRHLGPGPSHRLLSHGDHRAQRENHARRGDGRRAHAAFEPRSREAHGCASALFRRAPSGRRRRTAHHLR